MKKTILIVAVLLGGFVFETATAQILVSPKVNIGVQPVWGPAGYDYVDYYYIPDIDAFYYVPKRQYIYQQSGRWMFSTTVPPQFRNYDLYSGYKVVVNEPRPYRYAETYRIKYASYKGQRNQVNIRNSKDVKYYKIKGHPEHDKWKKEQKRPKN